MWWGSCHFEVSYCNLWIWHDHSARSAHIIVATRFTMLKPRCVHDSSSLGKGITHLTKLLGGVSYEKILWYNNLPLYATARWLPQQIPPLNFLAWSIVDIKNLQRAQKLHGFQSQVGLVHYVKITPIYLFPMQVLMLAITHPLWRIRSPIRGNTAMMRQSAIKYHHIQTLLMSTSCSTKRKVRINELDAGYRLVLENLNLNWFTKTSRDNLKNHCTNTRLVCTHFKAFF